MIQYALLAFLALAEASPQMRGGAPGGGGGGGGGRNTLLRFGCSQIAIERLDPLVNPGQNPSPHVHQIVGGNAFNVTMPVSDISKLATCTTCSFSDDLSNYWTANLYFKARNGSYHRVPQIPNRFLDGSQGGMTVYYTSPGPKKVTAFKQGFRMLFGDPTYRTKQGNGLKTQSCFRCYTGPNFQGDNQSPCFDSKLDTETFPAGPCLGGIRSNIHFPTCWDGVNLDSPNHREHVAYPTNGPASFATAGGNCPSTHPIKLPQVMLEIVWDTTGFNDKSLWPEDGSQPFVLSTGDPTGYGQHADYVFGWKDDVLQKAMDGGCFGATCSALKTQAFSQANKCVVPNSVAETVDGWLPRLPGAIGQ